MHRSCIPLMILLAAIMAPDARAQDRTVQARGGRIESPRPGEEGPIVPEGRDCAAALGEVLGSPAERGDGARVEESDLRRRQRAMHGGSPDQGPRPERSGPARGRRVATSGQAPEDLETRTALGGTALALGGLAGLFLWMRSRRIMARG